MIRPHRTWRTSMTMSNTIGSRGDTFSGLPCTARVHQALAIAPGVVSQTLRQLILLDRSSVKIEFVPGLLPPRTKFAGHGSIAGTMRPSSNAGSNYLREPDVRWSSSAFRGPASEMKLFRRFFRKKKRHTVNKKKSSRRTSSAKRISSRTHDATSLLRDDFLFGTSSARRHRRKYKVNKVLECRKFMRVYRPCLFEKPLGEFPLTSLEARPGEGEAGDAKLRGDEKPRSENARASERAETRLFSLLPRTSLRRIELPEYRDIRSCLIRFWARCKFFVIAASPETGFARMRAVLGW